RAMPIFALRKILPAFKIGKVSDAARMKALAKDAIQRLLKAQRSDGGWGFWGGSRYASLWITGYISYALLRAKEAGYTVPKDALARAKRMMLYRLSSGSWPYRWERKAYAVHALALWSLSEMGSFPEKPLQKVLSHKKTLPLFAKAWLMSTLHRRAVRTSGAAADAPEVRALLREIRNRAEETAATIRFAEHHTESLRLLMHTNDRTNAIILRCLLEVRPKDPMIPKIVRGMIQSRVRGRWSTTQANAYALLALSKYYAMYEKQEPNFRLQSWLGKGYLGQYAFKGRSMTIQEQKVPMAFLKQQGRADLVLAKKGAGRVYYRLGLRYAPKSLKLPPEEQGFYVTRQYEPVGDPKALMRRKDGTYVFQAGAYFRVRLRVVAAGRRYYVALVDPLPAGLEAVNLSFKTSASTALSSAIDNKIYDTRSWYSFFAFSHQEKRDSMVNLFANILPAGVYEYTYVARATTLGKFVIPPTRAEEMYHPEVFGRTATMFGEVVERMPKP
ncbi:MAG: hypothetical protein AAGJ35_03765, partial [Myxococcota bacterium]